MAVSCIGGENHQPAPQVTDKLYHIVLYRVQLTWTGFELTPLVVCTGIINVLFEYIAWRYRRLFFLLYMATYVWIDYIGPFQYNTTIFISSRKNNEYNTYSGQNLTNLLFVCNIFYFVYNPFHVKIDRIGCIVVSVPTTSTVYRVFYPRFGQTKVY